MHTPPVTDPIVPLVTMDTSKVTRVEVIEHTGRTVVRRPVSVQLSLQDDGRTLKVFIDPKYGN